MKLLVLLCTKIAETTTRREIKKDEIANTANRKNSPDMKIKGFTVSAVMGQLRPYIVGWLYCSAY